MPARRGAWSTVGPAGLAIPGLSRSHPCVLESGQGWRRQSFDDQGWSWLRGFLDLQDPQDGLLIGAGGAQWSGRAWFDRLFASREPGASTGRGRGPGTARSSIWNGRNGRRKALGAGSKFLSRAVTACDKFCDRFFYMYLSLY